MKVYSPETSHINFNHTKKRNNTATPKIHHQKNRQLWLVAVRFDDQYIYGTILNDKNCSRKVRIPLNQIEKWLFAFGGKNQGGFTILIQHNAPQSQNKQIKLNPRFDKKNLTSPQLIFIDEQGFTQLHRAAIAGDLQMVQDLLNAGWDSSILDKQGKTALDYAKLLNHTDIIQILSK